MCCIFFALLLVGPRFTLVMWWIFSAARFHAAFHGMMLGRWTPPSWLLPLAGIVFLPWTTIAYLLVFRGGVNGLDWLWLGLGVMFDLSTHGGGYCHRDRRRG